MSDQETVAVIRIPRHDFREVLQFLLDGRDPTARRAAMRLMRTALDDWTIDETR